MFHQILEPFNLKLGLYRGQIRTLSHFIKGQGVLQILNALNSICLLRWLNIEEQAKYSLTLSIQNTLTILTDLGFGGCIIAMVGNRINDPKILSQYISSAKYFRNRLFLVSVGIGSGAFLYLMSKHEWSSLNQLLLLLPLLSSVYWQSSISYYGAALQIHRQINTLYNPQVVTALCRLLICLIAYLSGLIDAVMVIWLYSLSLIVQAHVFRKQTSNWIDEKQISTVSTRYEMKKYLAPLFPSLLFNVISGQLVVYLISIFGKVQNIADVGALGRLSQLFVFIAAFNSVIVFPFFAKVPQEKLFHYYTYCVLISFLLMVPLVYIGFNHPQFYLWILGEKYKNLEVEVGWVVLTAAISTIGGVMWTIHSARKWVFWWSSILYIVLMLVIQTVLIYNLDFTTTMDSVYFSFFITLGTILVHVLVLSSGIIKSRNERRILQTC